MASNPGVTEELYGSYTFLLELSDWGTDMKQIVGGFESVTGMDGAPGPAAISLRDGYTATDDLFDWKQRLSRGGDDRRTGTIVVREDGREVARYRLGGARLRSTNAVRNLDGRRGAKLAEIELTVERLERA